MTANKEIIYWQSDEEWYTYDEELSKYLLTDKAPERAIKSFEAYREKKKDCL